MGEFTREEISAKPANSRIRSAGRRVKYLTVCKNYLLSEPSELFVKNEKERIADAIGVVNDRIGDVYEDEKLSEDAKREKIEMLKKEYKLKSLKEQYKTICFILNTK